MSVIEDVRKVVQDLIAPDLKAIDERLKAVDSRLNAAEAVAGARHSELLAKLEASNVLHSSRYEAILRSLDIDKRLEAIERDRRKETQPV